MGRARRTGCRLCMKPTTRGDTSTINNLPKTFAHILEEISGIKFTQADGLHVSVCNRCRDFLQAMEHHSQYPRSNKISGAGKKKVRRLMDKGFSASEAIDKVIAEKRARDLLAGAGVTKQGPAPMGQALQAPMNVQNNNGPMVDNRIRMSGAQRKKVQILVAGGVDINQARQLVLAASAPVVATPYQQVRPMLRGPNQRGPLQARLVQRGSFQGKLAALRGVAQAGGIQRKPVQRVVVTKDGVKKVITQKAPVQKGTPRNGQTVGPQKGATQKVPGQKGVAQKAPGQKGAQVKVVAQKPVNGPAQRAPNKKNTNTVANPQQNRQNNPNGGRPQNNQNLNRQQNNQNVNRQQNIQNTNRPQNNLQGGRQQNMGNGGRVQNVNTPRRNERVAPYNNNRGNNQGQQQTSSLEVGIIPINFPNVQLDDMKLDALKEAITNEIVKIPPGGPLIRFLGTSSQNGWLKVICADELSHNWLKMLVGRWERAGVRMVDGNSLPQPVVLSFYLPGDFRSPDEILNIVEKQNTALNTNQWRVINRETDGNGQTITVCVDEQSFQALQNCDFMVFLGLGVVELKPRRFPSDGGSMPNRALMQNARGNNNGNNARGNNNANNNRGGNNMNRSNYNNGGNNSNYSYGGNGGGGMGNNYQGNRSNNSGGGNGGGSYQQRQGMGQGQNYQRAGYQSQRSW